MSEENLRIFRAITGVDKALQEWKMRALVAEAKLEARATADPVLSGEWAIVPRIPTPKMVKAGRNVGHVEPNENARLKWSAMISAAPTPQTRTPSQ